MLKDIFKDIINNTESYSQAESGKEFELKFKSKLESYGYNSIASGEDSAIAIAELEKKDKKVIENKWKKIKKNVLEKYSIEPVENPFKNINNSFIFQPYGSQQFPDFLVFTNKLIIPIEIKFSSTKTKAKKKKDLKSFKPMWNSNIPKTNSIYIYGVSCKAVTFFKGCDVLDIDTGKLLIDYFKELNNNSEELNNSLDNNLKKLKNNFGFYPYIRKAYDQKVAKSTYINKGSRKTLESYFSENAKLREQNVIDFFEDLSNDKI